MLTEQPVQVHQKGQPMDIFYFTATGNSLVVARTIAEQLQGTIHSLPKIVKDKRLEWTSDAVGFVFPTYNGCIPAYVRQCLDQLTVKGEYIFAIATACGDFGGIHDDVKAFFGQKGWTVSYVNGVPMQDNFIPFVSMVDPASRIEPTVTAMAMEQIVEDIRRRVEGCTVPRGATGGSTNAGEGTAVVYDAQRIDQELKDFAGVESGEALDATFTVSDMCVSCSVCADVCPVHNIEMVDIGAGEVVLDEYGFPLEITRPQWQGHCMFCMACIQNCPQGAIHVRTEKDGERYRHPEVTVWDMLESNSQRM